MRKEILESPIAGIVSKLYVQTGDLVEADSLILELEIMKLFYSVTAGLTGYLTLIAQEGEFVQEGQPLGEILEAE